MKSEMPIAERTRMLVDCAMGRKSADLVIRDGQWVCVQTGEIIPHTDVAVIGGRIAYVGEDASYTIGLSTTVVNAEGRYLVPGLLDAHMHVESGMMTVTEFVRTVIPHGTTGMFIDPHEITNVLGMQGVKLMADEASKQPIHVWVQMPSCVPSAPGFETPGANITAADVAEAMTWDGIIGLGEMMNYPGVCAGDENLHAEMAATREAGKVIGGHYPSFDLGKPFHAYAAGGASDDHEGTRKIDAIARARQGMKVMMRYGSAWHDVAEQVRAVTEDGLDPRNFLLCTDDSHSQTLVTEGHIDRVVRFAISQGLKPITALQMATINTAEYFGVSQDIGSIAPGRCADILLVSDLISLKVEQVFCQGKLIAENGKLLVDLPAYSFPDWATHSVQLPRKLNASDFRIHSEKDTDVKAHVIGIIENQAPTRHICVKMTPNGGDIHADMKRDIAKVALIDRHTGSGRVQMGLVQGFGFNVPCAVATTVAHDSHQMIVVGTDDDDMAAAANELATCGGGQAVVSSGEVIGRVNLPIAGLMAAEQAEVVAKKAATVLKGFRTCGCTLNNPNMQLSLLALVVIPSLRISDLGLVDVEKFKFIPVIE